MVHRFGAMVLSCRSFLEKDTVLYHLPEGTKLPSDLVCLHEHTHHYSIHCAVPMMLHELNTRITEFCHKYGEAMTNEEFEERYPFV
ncbi:hypothetical protein IW261DRAFT_1371522 [Armillaria novae-zelandiae]|uniref:Tse2 ADP-ribosyltransferase toxin domain-containing protein n=1 Tax=Armillaria novae-zelandiae TaxID=153914 RepID=A0AA39NUE6_9AGAR|nr:hypothetical protein IW261DRAFT_1371522 [Armillaria novae-zelandiae]